MNNKKNKYFTAQLLLWNAEINRRSMPWKGEKDPYKIWLSEIILQQTRVEQGLAYYERYVKKYSTVQQLANAAEADVYKLWEGLGYYSRCKNLIHAAKFITDELDGIFPNKYENILQLKGVGPYTAAAISSFAYNLPHAVVDGNVMRVLARYFGISIPIDSTEGKKYFATLSHELLDKKNAAVYNQAIMDLGATICKPQQPLCSECYLKKECTAFQNNAVEEYPVKANKLVKKERWLYYIVAEYKNSFFVGKRTGKDIWQNLHEFLLIENSKGITGKQVLSSTAFKKLGLGDYDLVDISKDYKQQLTHQTIHSRFIYIRLHKAILPPDHELMKKSKIKELAFPRIITNYFQDNQVLF